MTCATKRKASGIVTTAGGAIRRTRYRWVKDTVLDNCRTVLYLHGFASSPNSQKIHSLRALLAPLGVELNTPDLNVPSFEKLDFDAMVERSLRSAAARRRLQGGAKAPHSEGCTAIVGSSLGSLVALEVVRRGFRVPMVLIAPGLGIRDQWVAKLPPGDPIEIFNFAIGEKMPNHRPSFE